MDYALYLSNYGKAISALTRWLKNLYLLRDDFETLKARIVQGPPRV